MSIILFLPCLLNQYNLQRRQCINQFAARTHRPKITNKCLANAFIFMCVVHYLWYYCYCAITWAMWKLMLYCKRKFAPHHNWNNFSKNWKKRIHKQMMHHKQNEYAAQHTAQQRNRCPSRTLNENPTKASDTTTTTTKIWNDNNNICVCILRAPWCMHTQRSANCGAAEFSMAINCVYENYKRMNM